MDSKRSVRLLQGVRPGREADGYGMAADIDLKKAAKFFANRFATGSSLSKNPQGEDEIFIQGDVADEVRCRLRRRQSVELTLRSAGRGHPARYRGQEGCSNLWQRTDPR